MNNSELKVSIIVPVYNSERYLNRCIDSILAQTYKNIEILLINDGSTDSSGEICDTYTIYDNRVRVIHKDNGGVSETRNIGLQEANGEYILFVDSDDYISSDMIDIMVSKAIDCNSDIVMCNYFIDKCGKITLASMDYKEVYDGKEIIKNEIVYLYYIDYHTGLYSLCNKLIKKNIYSINKIQFDLNLKRGEDAWFIFQCLKNCDRLDFIPKGLYYYYQNNNSIMHTFYSDQYEKWVLMRKRLLEENKTFGFKINYNLFYKEFLYKIAILCKSLILNGNKIDCNIILNDDFYRESSRYVERLPYHIKLLHILGRKYPYIAIIGYKIWNILSR